MIFATSSADLSWQYTRSMISRCEGETAPQARAQDFALVALLRRDLGIVSRVGDRVGLLPAFRAAVA